MAYCYDGKTYETIKEMAEEYGIDRERIYSFRHRGWSLEEAMRMCIDDVREMCIRDRKSSLRSNFGSNCFSFSIYFILSFSFFLP